MNDIQEWYGENAIKELIMQIASANGLEYVSEDELFDEPWPSDDDLEEIEPWPDSDNDLQEHIKKIASVQTPVNLEEVGIGRSSSKAKPNYKFRAECMSDVQKIKEYLQDDMEITSGINNYFHEPTVEFRSSWDLYSLLEAFDLPDCHVARQTLQPIKLYTGDRDWTRD